jgi:c-di-GMP-binding flagellar brake protein YcgR
MTAETAGNTNHLLRSRSKIAPVLEALAAKRVRITAELPGGVSAATQLLVADPIGEFIVIAATEEAATPALLALARVTLVAVPDGWHIEFVGTEPGAIEHEGAAAIRLGYPEILAVQQRRKVERFDAAPAVALRCVADAAGFAPFDAQIRDVSLGGISVLIYPPDVSLEPGAVLAGSRIEIPGGDPVTLDLEVRYSEIVTLPDGSRARCSGFRFVNASDDIKQKLIDAFEGH